MLSVVVQAVLGVNKALDQVSEVGAAGDTEAVLKALMSENLDLSDVIPGNIQYYREELRRAKKAKEVCVKIGGRCVKRRGREVCEEKREGGV